MDWTKKAKDEWRDEVCCFVRVTIFMIACKYTDTVPISRRGKILLHSLVLVNPYTLAYNQNRLWNSWYGYPTLHWLLITVPVLLVKGTK